MRIGYACINHKLRRNNMWTGRTLRKKTFEKRGLPYVSTLVKKNVNDLIEILEWNKRRGVRFFRMSSSIFPFLTWYEFEELPDFPEIESKLKKAGKIAKESGQRITQHPDHFVKIASETDRVLEKSLDILKAQSRVFDLMELEESPYNSINIHIGGAYGDKKATMERFCRSIDSLPLPLRKRLTVENDDKSALFTVRELVEGVHDKVQIPVVFDSLHYACNKGKEDYKTSLSMATETWSDSTPVVHHSNSKKLFENENKSVRGHTDYCYSKFYNFDKDVDIMLEAKMKEKARSRYVKKFLIE